MVRPVFILSVLLCLWSPAVAEGPNEPLTSDEIRAEFLGTRMSGFLFETGVRFVECIEPGGRSIYRYGDYSSEGAMTSVSEGIACFTYDDADFCYEMLRHPGGYIVSSVERDAHFLVSKVERNIQRCTTADLIG